MSSEFYGLSLLGYAWWAMLRRTCDDLYKSTDAQTFNDMLKLPAAAGTTIRGPSSSDAPDSSSGCATRSNCMCPLLELSCYT